MDGLAFVEHAKAFHVYFICELWLGHRKLPSKHSFKKNLIGPHQIPEQKVCPISCQGLTPLCICFPVGSFHSFGIFPLDRLKRWQQNACSGCNNPLGRLRPMKLPSLNVFFLSIEVFDWDIDATAENIEVPHHTVGVFCCFCAWSSRLISEEAS